MNMKFWKDKRVLITGFAGFLGSNLTKKMIASGAKVVGMDIKSGSDKTLLSRDDYKKINSIKGNIANYKLVNKVIEDNKTEIIFHLAAEAIVGKCFKEPVRTFKSNIEGTWNILENARNQKTIEAVVVASSDKAYGSHKQLPYEEEAPLAGSHPYDVSKSCTDLIANTYHRTYGVPVAVTRCGNIYGPGDFNLSRIMPDTIRSISKGKTLKIRSNGKFTRDYIFVDDIVEGYVLLAEKLTTLGLGGEAFNFSDEKPMSVLDLVEKVYKVADKVPNYKILDQADHEIPDQFLSAKKARNILGWKPKYSLDEGLRKTVDWYKQVK